MLVIAFLCSAAGAESLRPRGYQEVPAGPTRPFRVPQPDRIVLPNGLTLLLFRVAGPADVKVAALLRMGNAWDPPERPGLAWITGKLLEESRATWPGITLDAWVLDEYTKLLLSVPKENLAPALTRFAAVLSRPDFSEKRTEWQKFCLRERWRGRYDNPQEAADRELRQLLCATPGYGNLPDPMQAERIHAQEIQDYYGRMIGPGEVVLGIWGDIDLASIREHASKVFGEWRPNSRPRPAWPQIRWLQETGSRVIPEERTQSWMFLGFRGVSQSDPRMPALDVLHHLLGRGFSSRLFNTIRSRESLAYDIYTDLVPGWPHPGWLVVAGSTRSDQMPRLLQAVRRELKAFTLSGPTPQELRRAKGMITRSRVFAYDSADKIMNRQLLYAYYGVPRDFLDQHMERVAKVRAGDVRALAQRLVNQPQALVILGKEP